MANYPVPYQNNWGYGGIGQQMYPQYQQSMAQQAPQMTQAQHNGMIWTDGEVGAKAFQRPDWLPANQPVPLWDTNDTIIYLKSWNPMGMPNPLQKVRYELEGMKTGEKTTGYSGDTEPKHDMTQYVRKEDLERMKQDLIDTIGQMNSVTCVKRTNAKGE